MGQNNGKEQSTNLAAMTNGSYFYKPNAREMFPTGGVSKPPADMQTMRQWQMANARARLSSMPRQGAFSQFDAPMVSHLDPHQMKENPLDSYFDNVLMTLTTFKNRNNVFDPRGEPDLPPDWQSSGDSDSLVQIRNVERLAYHGPISQIVGCTPTRKPKY